MLSEQQKILEEFRKALVKHAHENVVNLDDGINRKFDFQVYRFEDVFHGTHRSNPPNRWSYYRIAFIKKGSGMLMTGMHTFHATKNTLLVVPPRVITSSKDWSLDMEGYIVLFNLDFFLQSNFPYQHIENRRIVSGGIHPFVTIPEDSVEKVSGIFETILRESEEDQAEKTVLIALKIIELLIESDRLFDAQFQFENNVPVTDIIKNFTNLVEANFIKERTVTFYAEKLNVHPNYLNALIKKHTGKTAKESIQNRLLLEIKYLLHSTNLSIKAISNELGFNDPNYFSSFFKRFENVSPKEYRSTII